MKRRGRKMSRKSPQQRNVERVKGYLRSKRVYSGYIFGSALKKSNPQHDIDVAVNLKPTRRNVRRFEDATKHGIDLFLLGRGGTLYSTGLDEVLYTDKGMPQDLESVGAKPFRIRRKRR